MSSAEGMSGGNLPELDGLCTHAAEFGNAALGSPCLRMYSKHLLSPFYSSTMKDDKVAAELDRLQAPITLPSKQIDRVPLTPQQYDRYQILAAHPQGMPSLREKLEEVIASDLYRHGTDDPGDGGKITLLKMWVNNYRDLAKFQLRQEDVDLDAKLRERETKKAGAFAGTAPGGLSR